MSDISAHLVKELRDKTGAGFMDCKKALAETAGDLEAAIDWLRKKGIAKAGKKADRVAAEGAVFIKIDGQAGVVVEVNSETDFVSKNDKFQAFGYQVVTTALTQSNLEGLLQTTMGSETVQAQSLSLTAVIGEKIEVRRMQKLTVKSGVIAGYVHNKIADSMGKMGVLVAIESNSTTPELKELGHKIAMHVAAMNPLVVKADQVPQELIEREKAILEEQFAKMNKPKDITDKMLEGALNKFKSEAALLNQPYALDGKITIQGMLDEYKKATGNVATVTQFARCVLGEGIEKAATNFADEVASVAKGS